MSAEEINLLHLCRLCLQLGEDSTAIFDEDVFHQPEEARLSSKIMACVSVRISPTDQGPHKICNKCLNNVNTWFKFKEECKLVDQYLQAFVAELAEQTEQTSKVDDRLNLLNENSLLGEISLPPFDSSLEKSLDFAANLSPSLDFCFNYKLNDDDLVKDTSKPIEYVHSNIQSQLYQEIPLYVDPNESSLCNQHNNEPLHLTIANSSSTILDVVDNSSERDHSEPCDHIEDAIDTFNKQEKKGHHCDLCDITFTRFVNLLNHDDIEHRTVPRQYCCSTCQREFICENRLHVHSLSHREKTHKCTTCHKVFISKKSLEVHSRLHTGKYKCNACGYLSTSKLYLQQHLLKHIDSGKLHVCSICSKSCSTKSSLTRHENIHLKPLRKCFKCQICPVVARSHYDLKQHMKQHENINEVFNCHLCDKKFKLKKTLQAHLARHEDAKFICGTCDRRLFSKWELRVHEETHSNSKHFDCFHCDKKFSFRNTLVKHLRKYYPRIRSDIKVQ